MNGETEPITELLQAKVGGTLDKCPTINGFPHSMVGQDDPDAENIVLILSQYTRINELQSNLSQKPSEADRQSLIEVIQEKQSLDGQLASQGIFAEAEVQAGEALNILYTTPRKRWNPAARHLVVMRINGDSSEAVQ